MLMYISSTVILLIATYLISKKFGLWAGLTVAGAHVFANSVDYFVDGNLTTFRQVFYSVLAFLLLIAYFKTVDKLNL